MVAKTKEGYRRMRQTPGSRRVPASRRQSDLFRVRGTAFILQHDPEPLDPQPPRPTLGEDRRSLDITYFCSSSTLGCSSSHPFTLHHRAEPFQIVASKRGTSVSSPFFKV